MPLPANTRGRSPWGNFPFAEPESSRGNQGSHRKLEALSRHLPSEPALPCKQPKGALGAQRAGALGSRGFLSAPALQAGSSRDLSVPAPPPGPALSLLPPLGMAQSPGPSAADMGSPLRAPARRCSSPEGRWGCSQRPPSLPLSLPQGGTRAPSPSGPRALSPFTAVGGPAHAWGLSSLNDAPRSRPETLQLTQQGPQAGGSLRRPPRAGACPSLAGPPRWFPRRPGGRRGHWRGWQSLSPGGREWGGA